jgi:DnaJ-class molecular chaperone
LKYHPDKNNAENATEIFKKISVAYACLSDEDKRKMYDLHGNEEGFQNTFNPNDIDINQVFNMFFSQMGGDGFPGMFNGGSSFTVYSNLGGTKVYRAGGRQNQRRQQQEFYGGNLFDLLNGMNEGHARRRRQPQQEHEDDDPMNIFNQQRNQRGRNNRNVFENKAPVEVTLAVILNQCMP